MATLILFVLIFGVVVISHEFGHFLLAKANGIHVVEFSVGMGPNLFSFQKGVGGFGRGHRIIIEKAENGVGIPVEGVFS